MNKVDKDDKLAIFASINGFEKILTNLQAIGWLNPPYERMNTDVLVQRYLDDVEILHLDTQLEEEIAFEASKNENWNIRLDVSRWNGNNHHEPEWMAVG